MKRWLVGVIHLYRRFLGVHLPPVCRFQPTCSHYAEEALERHGALKGSMLAGWRLLRCNPWGESGWDPVPAGHWGAAWRRRLIGAPLPPPTEGDPS